VTRRRGRKRNQLLDDLNEWVLIFFVPWTPFESLVKLTDHFSEIQWELVKLTNIFGVWRPHITLLP